MSFSLEAVYFPRKVIFHVKMKRKIEWIELFNQEEVSSYFAIFPVTKLWMLRLKSVPIWKSR